MDFTSNKNIFEKVDGLEKNSELWKQMVFSQIAITCSLGDKKEILIPKRKDHLEIYCSSENLPDIVKIQNKSVVGQFKLADTQYFFYSTYRLEPGYLVINCDVPLYKLQRRQVYRLKVPRTFGASATILKVGDDETHIKTQLIDLGVGGCGLALVQDLKLKENSTVLFQLNFDKREPQNAEGVIRFSRKDLIQGRKHYLIGLQFKNTTASLDSTLFSVMMELSRKYLVK